MGSLVSEIPISEAMATLEILDVRGVTRADLQRFRGASVVEQVRIADAIRGPFPLSNPPKRWHEEGGVIYFWVTSDGTTGKAWITRLKSRGLRVGDYAKQVLRSPDFKPTSGVTTEVAVLKGMLFEDNDRTTKKIRAEADRRKLSKPNAELACLIREKFTDKEIEAMGLWYIVAMHEPINDSVGDPRLLCADRVGGGRWLNACSGRPGGGRLRDRGFAFAVSQVGSHTPVAVPQAT